MSKEFVLCLFGHEIISNNKQSKKPSNKKQGDLVNDYMKIYGVGLSGSNVNINGQGQGQGSSSNNNNSNNT